MRWAVSWVLYRAGDIVWRLIDKADHENFSYAGYRLYQWLMCNSACIQGDGPGPWKEMGTDKV